MSQNLRTFILLLIILILLGLLGREILMHRQGTQEQATAVQPAATTSPTRESQSQSITTSTSTATSADTCALDLQKQTAAKHTQYEKGTILVSFKSTISFDDALSVLLNHHIVVQNQTQAESSYPSLHVITATVEENQEFAKICELRGDPSVKYAGLNTFFNLHE